MGMIKIIWRLDLLQMILFWIGKDRDTDREAFMVI